MSVAVCDLGERLRPFLRSEDGHEREVAGKPGRLLEALELA